MDVKIWGTRGTFPVPGPTTVRYGGDTTCVSVETDDRVLVIDTGTGTRLLGESLFGDGREIAVLYTHIHADHVMGFPFFKPLWEAGRTISLIDHRLGGCEWSATALLDGAHFPLTASEVPCALRRVSRDPVEFLADFGFSVSRTLLNHPGGAYGYRVEAGDEAFVFIPDNEIAPRREPTTTFEELVEFCAGATVLAHDAQYTQEELDARCGWGHSSPAQACDLALAAEVKTVVLTHHDPARTDDALDEVHAEMQTKMAGSGIDVEVARDGSAFQLGFART